jgi:tetratricopeptide (TPR) repeat protein
VQRISRTEWTWLGLLAVAVAIVYLPGLDNPPVFDDDYLASGELFRDYANTLQLRARMLSYGSFVWVHALFGEGWWKQRLVNVLIHAGVVLALWGFYRELLRHIAPPEGETAPLNRSPALGVALAAFALNPVAVYAVAYLIQRSILLATLFVLLSLTAFARGVRTGKAAWFAAAVIAYGLAVASKEHAILTPLAAMPVLVLVARPSPRRLGAVAAIGLGLVGIAWVLLRQRYGDIIGTPFDEYSRVYLSQLAALQPDAPKHAYALSIINQAWLFFGYGVRWMLPWTDWMSISLRPPFPLTYATFPQLLGPIGYLGVIAGGAWLLWRYRDWRALLGISLLVPALLFATEFAVVWVQDPFVLYRSYLWAIGIPGLVFCMAHGPSPKILLAIGLVIAVYLAYTAIDRVVSLDTPERAWSDAIAKLPQDPRAVGRWFPYLNRGALYVDRDEFALALRDFEKSEALGDLGMGAFNTGAVLAAQGKHADALAAFDRAQRQGYDLYNLPFQRGLSLMALNRPAEAYAEFQKARAKDPPSPTRELMLLDLGKLGLQLNHADQAIQDLQQLVTIDPKNQEGRYLLAMAVITHGQPERGKALLDAVIAEGNAAAPAYYGRALAHYGLKQKAEARADIAEAIRRDPGNAMLREWAKRIDALPAKP